jgi:hypothetical protein
MRISIKMSVLGENCEFPVVYFIYRLLLRLEKNKRLLCKYCMYKVQHMDQISIKTPNPKSQLFLKIDQ